MTAGANDTASSQAATSPAAATAKADHTGQLADSEKPASPETVQRAMRKMQEGAPEQFMEVTAMMGSMMGHPLHSKMNAEHITRVLDLSIQHDKNEHDLATSQQKIDSAHDHAERAFRLVYFLVFIGLIIFVVKMFVTQAQFLAPILTGIGGVATGFLGGIGYARAKQPLKSKSD